MQYNWYGAFRYVISVGLLSGVKFGILLIIAHAGDKFIALLLC